MSGCQDAQKPPVDIRSKDRSNELELLRAAAAHGKAEAQRELAMLYFGGELMPKNAALAVYWWRKAAAQGDDSAQDSLAWMYFNGEGVVRDTAQSVRWWQKAAASGNGDSQASLGWVYFNGVGTAADPVLGYAWTNLAAGQGIERARENRDIFEKALTPDQIAQAQALSTAWKAQIDRLGGGNGSSGPAGRMQKVSEGTLFVINRRGDAVTAHHVIDGCGKLRVRNRGGWAKVLATDRDHDLALVAIPGRANANAKLAIDPGGLRQGDPIIVYGFPLNAVLATGGNLTPGIISALTGLGNDPNQVQITAPIQPGSSGSPVMDERGTVVGVISMTLSNARTLEATGGTGQNVNFAVSGQRLNAFLDSHGADYERGGGFFSFRKSAADIADEARRWTLVIECWK